MRPIKFIALIAATIGTLASQTFAQTWTPLTNSTPTGTGGVALLMTDGTVMVSASTLYSGESNRWSLLHPDSAGNYVNGTWTVAGSMSTARLWVGSNVLPDGRLFVVGGEYSSEGGFTNSGEIFDPTTNRWTRIATFPQANFGDDPTVLLNTGKILCGYILGAQTYLYDPQLNTWTATGTKLRGDRSDEETWTLLPDGSVLSYDIFASPATGPGTAQRYQPLSGRWVTTGPVPVPLTNLTSLGAELGPQILLPDGRVFLVGANNNTVLYRPSTDTWTQGPSLPANMGCDDAPGVLLPNGHVLIIADTSQPVAFTPPARMFEFDPTANTLTDVTPTGALGAIFASALAQQFSFLNLPNGHVLLTTADGTLWDYTPAGSPNVAWQPHIQSITKKSATTYNIRGTLLNGISEGSSFGDDLENSTNYPIVKIKTATGIVKYAKTTNWNPGVVASGSRLLSTDFTLPTGLNNGVYEVTVIANGIPSATQQFVIGPPPVASNVTAVFNSATKTLTLTGDASANSLTVSLSAGKLLVQGANGTKINNTTSFSTAFPSGALTLIANMNAGNDALSVIGINSSTTSINMGDGTDKVAITLCHITNLSINGGSGVDTVVTTSSSVGHLAQALVP